MLDMKGMLGGFAPEGVRCSDGRTPTPSSPCAAEGVETTVVMRSLNNTFWVSYLTAHMEACKRQTISATQPIRKLNWESWGKCYHCEM